ncbi:MAG TPA: TolC family protein [Pirellulales bacterium]|jgi:outer membrane protein TolC|nr:TolC family protein [Pirellulales bacterium]
MPHSNWHRLAMITLPCVALGVVGANRTAVAAEPVADAGPELVGDVIRLPPMETIRAGPMVNGPVATGPAVTRPAVACPDPNGHAFQGATLSAAAPSGLPTAEPQVRAQDKPLPINLATALRLSSARPLVIAAAQASEEVAAAQLDLAKVLWLPNINLGASYYGHVGAGQGNSGTSFDNTRNQTLVGGGASAVVATTDAIFTPLAARQVVQSRNLVVQAARNDALLTVAEAYFNVQQARGRLAGAQDSVEKARSLVTTVRGLSAGLVAPIEVNRAQTLLAAMEQSHAVAMGSWGAASAELTRALRLDPTAMVVPMEPPYLQVTLIARDRTIDELIPIGLLTRPELASQKALVQAALVRLKQERMRPLLPSVVLYGAPVPTAPGGYLMGGAFFANSSGGAASVASARNDVNVQLLWTLNNMGFGNVALVRERRAEQQQTLIELFRVQDNVAAEIARIHAELDAAAARIPEAEAGVKQAQISFAGNLKGLSQTTRFGDLLTLINRPQEVVAALQQLSTAYENYFAAVNDFNRSQFRLYHALGYPAGIIAERQPLGEIQPVDTSRPEPLPPVPN